MLFATGLVLLYVRYVLVQRFGESVGAVTFSDEVEIVGVRGLHDGEHRVGRQFE